MEINKNRIDRIDKIIEREYALSRERIGNKLFLKPAIDKVMKRIKKVIMKDMIQIINQPEF